ncbi:MAG: lysylphosphatidylglycerol synthase transmembrane domain-containing protein [Chthoniobacteraceae bacterium]
MKRVLVTVFQLLITGAVLWWVFRDPVKRAEIGATLLRADATWLLIGLAGYGFVEVLAAARWQCLLRVQEIHLSFRRVLGLTMIGVFFNFFIPGGTGGDAVKMFYLVKETPGRRGKALLSVIVDRLIGLFALIVFAGVLIGWKWSWLMSAPGTPHWVYLALAVLAASLVFIAASFVITGFGLVHRLPARMPGRDKLADLALAYNVYGRAWRPALAAFVLSLVAHAGYFGVFYCSLRALASAAMKIPTPAEFFAIMPIIGTITALPISIGGVGWREVLFETFFGGLCGAPAAVAVAISSSGYLLLLAWGLVGALVYACYRPTEHAPMGEIRSEVREIEHALAEEEVALETKLPPQ